MFISKFIMHGVYGSREGGRGERPEFRKVAGRSEL